MARGGARPNAGRKPKADKPQREKKPRVAKSKPEAAEATAPAVPVQAKPSSTAHLAPFQFQPGQSGNPAGRAKGSRNKLGEAFLADFYDDWIQHGRSAIAQVREERPQDYLKAAVQILPKELNVRVGEFDELSDDDLQRRIRQLVDLAGISAGADGKETTH